MPERPSAVETETRNAKNGELHRQRITLLAARIVTGRIMNSGYFTVREGGGVEACRLKRVLVEPEADGVLWLHVSIFLVIDQGELTRSRKPVVLVASSICPKLAALFFRRM